MDVTHQFQVRDKFVLNLRGQFFRVNDFIVFHLGLLSASLEYFYVRASQEQLLRSPTRKHLGEEELFWVRCIYLHLFQCIIIYILYTNSEECNIHFYRANSYQYYFCLEFRDENVEAITEKRESNEKNFQCNNFIHFVSF